MSNNDVILSHDEMSDEEFWAQIPAEMLDELSNNRGDDE